MCRYKQSGVTGEKEGIIEGEKDAEGKDKNIVIKANRLILGIMDKTPVQNTVDGEQLEPLKIKKSIQAASEVVGNIENVLMPFTTNWYQIDLKRLQASADRTLKLYLNSPKGITESVLNLYAHNVSDDVKYLIKKGNGATAQAFSPFLTDQLIKLTPTDGQIEIRCGKGDTAAEGVLLISSLSFIKGLNPVLDPILTPVSATATESDKLDAELGDLEYLRRVCDELAGEHTFYDTCPINNQVAIDFAGKDDINSYTTWLDKNNINNNFVVCQLDSDFSNIRLTRASKIN